MIRNGDSVCVAAQVAQYVLWTAEGTLRVDHPVVAEQLTEPGGEGLGLGEKSQISMKSELAIGKRAFESGHELATENPAEHFDWQKERVTGFDPTGVIGRQTTSRDYRMHVRVVFQFLIPGVQHAEEADFRAEVFGVARDLQEGFRAGLEQQTVNHFLVLQGQGRQFVR